MFTNLNAVAAGINLKFEEVIELAKQVGFEGVDINIVDVSEIIKEKNIDYVKNLSKGIKLGAWDLPIDWRAQENKFQDSLKKLEEYAKTAQKINCFRTFTWIRSWSDDLDFEENYKFHLNRLKPIAKILNDHNCIFGLEFLGPKTLRKNHKYEFIHTSNEMLQLCKEISPTTGLLLDSFHWYTSYGKIEDIKKLSNKDIIYVHINDAPKNVSIDKHIDNIRCLPGETGVIDLVGFLTSLKNIGYEGPVTPEPFKKWEPSISNFEKAKITYDALMTVWKKIL